MNILKSWNYNGEKYRVKAILYVDMSFKKLSLEVDTKKVLNGLFGKEIIQKEIKFCGITFWKNIKIFKIEKGDYEKIKKRKSECFLYAKENLGLKYIHK